MKLNRTEAREKIMVILYQIDFYVKEGMSYDIDEVIKENLEIDNKFALTSQLYHTNLDLILVGSVFS